MPQRQRLRQSCGQASLWQKSQSTKPPLLPGQEQTDGGVMKSVWPRNASGPHESVASSITRRLGGGAQACPWTSVVRYQCPGSFWNWTFNPRRPGVFTEP